MSAATVTSKMEINSIFLILKKLQRRIEVYASERLNECIYFMLSDLIVKLRKMMN